jgi:Rad3-related DNA helicase
MTQIFSRLKLDYEHMKLSETIENIGKSVSQIVKTVKGGTLIFFTSYYNMDKCFKQWYNQKLFLDLDMKHVLTEKNEKRE